MSIEREYEESTLLALLARDSEYAFQLIFDRHRDHIYKVAMLYVKSPGMAEEIVQDVFLKLWIHRRNLPQLHSLESWLYTLTRNITLNYLKKLANEWTVRDKWRKQSQQSENTADHKIRDNEYQRLLQQAIDSLPEQQKQVYRLSREQGLSYEAIGRQLNISPLTVKTHMARALAAIRSFFFRHGELFVLLLIAGAKKC